MFIHTILVVLCTAAQDPSTMLVETPLPPVEDPHAVPPSVAVLLGGYETAPTPAQWRTLPAEDRQALARVAQDPTQTLQRRALALDGMGVLEPSLARTVAHGMAHNESADPALRAAAVRVLARVVTPENLLAELGPVLEGAAAPALRVVAAQELVKTHKAASCRAVQAQRGRDVDHALLWKDVRTTCR
jgi:hypothetical protein